MHAVDLDDRLVHLCERRYDAERQQCEPEQVFPVHVCFSYRLEHVSKAEDHAGLRLGLDAVEFANDWDGHGKLEDQISLHEVLHPRRDVEQPAAGILKSAGAIAGSVGRIITSPIVVPFQRMFSEQPSVDGEYECREAWERDFDAPG